MIDTLKRFYKILKAHANFYEYEQPQDLVITLSLEQVKLLRNALMYLEDKKEIDTPDVEHKDCNYVRYTDSITKENIIEILSNIHSSNFSDEEKIWAISRLLNTSNTIIYNRINKRKMQHILIWIMGSDYFNSDELLRKGEEK